MPNTEEARLAHPQGADVPGPSRFGPDHYAEPVTDDSNHVREMAASHEGRPTVAAQKPGRG